MSKVHSLLVTGTDDSLYTFHFLVCSALNAIERRGQTMCYTCLAEDLQLAKDSAQLYGLTLQEIVRVEGEETYPTLVQGKQAGWKQ